MSNEKPEKEHLIMKHLVTARCPKCGAVYLAHDGHRCRTTSDKDVKK